MDSLALAEWCFIKISNAMICGVCRRPMMMRDAKEDVVSKEDLLPGGNGWLAFI
jgi:hypothetical protein